MSKEQDIVEGNKAIAEFMGAEWNTERDWYYFPLPKNQSFSVGKLQYHSSWDWLMPCS